MQCIRPLCLALLLGAWTGVSAEAPVVARAAQVELSGFDKPFVLDADVMAQLPRVSVSAQDHGKTATWEGVRLQDVLLRAGAPLGAHMRGGATAQVVMIRAADGYRTAFALAEFDDGLGKLEAVLADTRDGEPLSAHEGPYRLVLPSHQRGARSIRQITRIELIRLD